MRLKKNDNKIPLKKRGTAALALLSGGLFETTHAYHELLSGGLFETTHAYHELPVFAASRFTPKCLDHACCIWQ